MTDKPAYMGLAQLKLEGTLQDYETGEVITDPERIAAYRADAQRRLDATKAFEKAVAMVPEVLTPSWVATRYAMAEATDERGSITYLRRLVLWRMASGKIEHPQECAAIVMPEGEEPYSVGW